MPRKQERTSSQHTLRHWRFEVVDITLWALPSSKLGDGSVEKGVDDVILAFCGWCGNGTVLLNPSEWFASRRTIHKKSSNRQYVGRSCPYCFATCLLPDKAEYDALVEAGRKP